MDAIYSHATGEEKYGFPGKSTNKEDTSYRDILSLFSSRAPHRRQALCFLSQHNYLFSTLSASLDVLFTSWRLLLYNKHSKQHHEKVVWGHSEKVPSTSEEESFYQNLARLELWSWTFSLQNWAERIVCCLNPQFGVFCYSSPSWVRPHPFKILFINLKFSEDVQSQAFF